VARAMAECKDRSELPAVHRELRSHRAHNKGRADY
jgi:hypothetical protein